MIHVIGDSHVMVFSGRERIPTEVADEGFLPFFRTYRLGPCTAYNAEKQRGLIDSIVERRVGPYDSVMLCFGEIDCRAHLIKQSEMQSKPLGDVVADCVRRYARLFDIGEKHGVRLLVWGLPASSREDIECGDYSTHGTCAQRNEATRLFNKMAEEECAGRGIPFVSIFDKLVDDGGLTRVEYYADAIHLSQRAMPLILAALREKMLIDTRPRAAKGGNGRGEAVPREVPAETAQSKRVLIWSGPGEIARFIAARPRYDIAYVIGSDKACVRAVETLFGNDAGVRVFHMTSVNLLDFCRHLAIERVETLAMHCGPDDLDIIRTLECLIKRKRVSRIECEVWPGRLKALARLCGDAYDVAEAGQTAGGLTGVRCVLMERAGHTPYGRIPYVFNVVYSHLRSEQAHSVHRGNATVIWSRMPVEECDLYLYINACSFTGRQEGLNVLLLSEPPVVLPGQYDEEVWRSFDHVITFYDMVVEGRENFTKALLHRSGTHRFMIDGDITEERAERERKYPLAGRIPGICMINGNKASNVAGELYSKRVEAALWFHEHSAVPFDVFGNPPFSLPNYRGTLPEGAKLATLARYRFNLAFENIHDPVLSSGYVDKILSCLETRTVPIYLGAPDIDTYIPRECFIDFRSFGDYRELERFLGHMSEEQYAAYIESIDAFVEGGGLRPYSWDALYDQLIRIYSAARHSNIEEVCATDGDWDWGPGACSDRVFRELPGTHPWPWEYLAKGPGEVVVALKKPVTGRRIEDKAISASVDRLRRPEGGAESPDVQANLTRLRGLVERGAADVNDHYLYAQYLIMAKEFDEAAPALKRVLDLLPNHTYALNDLGAIHNLKKDYDAAISFYKRSVEAEPRNDNALRNLLRLLKDLGRETEMTGFARDFLYRTHSTEGGPGEAMMGVLREFNLDAIAPEQARGARPAGERPADVHIMDGTLIDSESKVGDHTYIGYNCFITKASIGRYCSIANSVKIGQGEHDISRVSTSAVFYERPYESLTKEPCVIGNDVWIGVDSIVRRGVTIGDGAVIGANSFVNTDVPDYAIAAGSPAKVLKFRFPPERIAAIKASRWWDHDVKEAGEIIGSLESGAGPEAAHGRRAVPGAGRGQSLAALVFSKDRAMQLHATLRSLLLHDHDRDLTRDGTEINVIYTTSNLFHERLYLEVAREFPGIRFVRERAFRDEVLSSLDGREYVLFMVDDNIFVRDFSLRDVVAALGRNPRSVGFSLRLGANTTHCYMHRKDQSVPALRDAGGNMRVFDWTASEDDFGYPLEVSSSVYRVPDILPLLKAADFHNPNTLEALLDASKSAHTKAKPDLLCYVTSVAFCNPANKVQNVWAGNRAGDNDGYSADNLARAFMKGFRIDIARYQGFTPSSCHQEADYLFERKDGPAGGDILPMDMPLVTIGILNRNGLDQIKLCLEAVARNTPEEHEIIIVDNGSTDGSVEYLRSLADIVLVENPENLGPTTRNRFLTLARGRYIVFLDNDTMVTKDWLTRLVGLAGSDRGIGIIGACANYASGPQLVQHTSYKDIEELERFAARRAAEYGDTLWLSPRLVTMCVLLRRELVERIGGLDEGFGMFGFEDDDYALRATIAGFRSVVAPGVFIHHTGGPQGRGDREYNGWLQTSWAVFKKKWGLPPEAQFGMYDPEAIVRSHAFDPSRHYAPLPDRGSVEKLIYNLSAYRARLDGPAGREAQGTAEDHFGKALAYEEEGSVELAIEELWRVLRIDENHAAACNGLGTLYYRKGDIPKALQMLSKAVMLQPDNIGNLKSLAAVALEAGETEDAIGLYNHILTLDPEDVETLLVVGRLCEQCGQTENALRFFRVVLDREPGNVQAAEAVRRIGKPDGGGVGEAGLEREARA